MKRLFALALVLLLLAFSACGTTEPDAVTTASIATTAAEIETTTEYEAASEPDTTEEHPTGAPQKIGTSEIFVKMLSPYGPPELWLRSGAGKEECLLGYNEAERLAPYLVEVINERYFLFIWAVFESDVSGSPQLYDLQEKRVVKIVYSDGNGGHYCKTINGKLYLVFAAGGLGVSADVGLCVVRVDLAKAAGGGPVVAEDLLKGVPEYDALTETIRDSDPVYDISPDARYFAIHAGAENPALYVFDIREQKLALKRELSGLTDLLFKDANTLVWLTDGSPAEVTLPIKLAPLEI